MTQSSPDSAQLPLSPELVLKAAREVKSHLHSLNKPYSAGVVDDCILTIENLLSRLSAGTSEPVAYRWRQPGNKHWIYDPTPEWIEDHKHEIELEPLFNGVAQPAPDCSCARAGFPNSCYNCDAEAADIVNALRKLYESHPICQQAANYIERSASAARGPTEPLQCLRCGTVDAFGPVSKERVGASWQCVARRQGAPGGNAPADCDWPGCGCDPAASKVLEAIDEAGFDITPRPLIQKIEAEARRYAEMYPQSSDGRNTFVIFADWVAGLTISSTQDQTP